MNAIPRKVTPRPLVIVSIAGLVLGTLLTLAPFAGVFGTVISLMREFQQLNHPGISDPSVISGQAGGALIPTIVGVLLCPIGIWLFVVSLKYLRRLPSPTPSHLSAS